MDIKYGIYSNCMIRRGHYVLGFEYLLRFFDGVSDEFWNPRAVNLMLRILEDFEDLLFNRCIFEEFLKSYIRIVNMLPENARANYLFGKIFLRTGELNIAEKHLRKAWKLVQTNDMDLELLIERSLQIIRWYRIPRWHFRALNSPNASRSYENAIRRAIEHGCRVILNIHSSFGKLGLYAGSHRSNPCVVSLTSTAFLNNACMKLMKTYCPGVTHYRSTFDKPHIPNELKDEANCLIVTDMFDLDFLKSGLLEMIDFCFKTVTNEKIKIIPSAVKLYITGIFSKDLNNRYRVQNAIPTIGLEEMTLTQRSYGHTLTTYQTNWYDFEIVTERTQFLYIEFNYIASIMEVLQKNWCKEIELKVITDGLINCLVLTYDLFLDDEIIISNKFDDVDRDPCLSHGVYHCPITLHFRAGQKATYLVEIVQKTFHFDPKFDGMDDVYFEDHFFVSESLIRFLNDNYWVQALIAIGEKIVQKSKRMYVADFCKFPLLGLMFARQGHKVYHFFNDANDIPLFEYLIEKNSIDPALICFLPYFEYPEFIATLKQLDYVFHEPIHEDGSLKKSPCLNVAFRDLEVREIFDHLIPQFVLVYSKCLNNFNVVGPKDVERFPDLAYINEYSGYEQPYFSECDFSVMSETKTWLMMEDKKKFSLRTIKKGKINGIMVWYRLFNSETNVSLNTLKTSCFSTYAFRLTDEEVEKHQTINILARITASGVLSLKKADNNN